MKALLKRYIITFVAGIVVFAIGKLLFLFLNGSVYQHISVAEVFRILYHGFSMDCTVAAYVAALPSWHGAWHYGPAPKERWTL